MSTDFKEKRINYLNNWPNVEPFEIEKKYYDKVKRVKDENEIIFKPFPLKKNNNVSYNKTISYMIEAIDQIERYPNFSFEFIFKAYDCFIKEIYSTPKNITDKNRKLCDNEWKSILNSNASLKSSFENLIANIPVKTCQYIYIKLVENGKVNKTYGRVTTDVSNGRSTNSDKRKEIVDAIEAKYGLDYANYGDSIRKASLLYRYLLKNTSISIDSKTYNIEIEDKLHILVSGLLYSLRNDVMHGSSISITKSSKTTLGAFAFNYFAYLLLYYLLLILIIDKFSGDYASDVFNTLADNIDKNVDLYKNLFGKELEK